MLDTLSNTYMIATRMDGFAAPPRGEARHHATHEPDRIADVVAPATPGLLGRIVRRWRRWRTAERTKAALAGLDAHQLRDIGLSEADVPQAIHRPDLRFRP